jgi:hypothetical protein
MENLEQVRETESQESFALIEIPEIIYPPVNISTLHQKKGGGKLTAFQNLPLRSLL